MMISYDWKKKKVSVSVGEINGGKLLKLKKIWWYNV